MEVEEKPTGQIEPETKRRKKSRGRIQVKSQLERVKWQSQVDMEDGKPQPNSILKVTKESYDKAMEYLNAPAKKAKAAIEYYCNSDGLNFKPRAFESLMSDGYMFQQMTNSLEEGDLDGFLAAETGAFGTRKARQLQNDLTMVSCSGCCCPDRFVVNHSFSFQAALYALFYHPAGKDPEVFNRSIESLFNNNRRSKMGSAAQILKTINKSFAFTSESPEWIH